jgi:hypothetical protein
MLARTDACMARQMHAWRGLSLQLGVAAHGYSALRERGGGGVIEAGICCQPHEEPWCSIRAEGKKGMLRHEDAHASLQSGSSGCRLGFAAVGLHTMWDGLCSTSSLCCRLGCDRDTHWMGTEFQLLHKRGLAQTWTWKGKSKQCHWAYPFTLSAEWHDATATPLSRQSVHFPRAH